MSRTVSCSHCFRSGHSKRTCPDKGLSHDEATAKLTREYEARKVCIERIAKAIAECPIESRCEITVLAFREATEAATHNSLRAMWDRDLKDQSVLAQAIKPGASQ